MAELYLVRHGQASFGSDNYDQLSELGYQQSTWLGEYFNERSISFDRIITGDMARQQQTAKSICTGLIAPPKHEVHTGFNEFDFHELILAYVKQTSFVTAVDLKNPRQAFALLREGLLAWSKDEIDLDLVAESWQQFSQRVVEALLFAQQGNCAKTLVVSSGGAMSMLLKHVMAYDNNTLINVNLQTKNTGMHHFFYNEKSMFVTGVNHIPHLDQPDRMSCVTYA